MFYKLVHVCPSTYQLIFVHSLKPAGIGEVADGCYWPIKFKHERLSKVDINRQAEANTFPHDLWRKADVVSREHNLFKMI